MTALLVYGVLRGRVLVAQGGARDLRGRGVSGAVGRRASALHDGHGVSAQHREALAGLFVQVLQLCSRSGLSTVGHVSLDGTKIAASASKHKAMSYGRMKQEEQAAARRGAALVGRSRTDR